MTMFSFGQPDGGIVQTAYVVPNLFAAIEAWIASLGVGPWFVAEHFKGTDMRYRGNPTNVDVSIGIAFTGHMCIELIMQHDEQPSIFHEVVAARGYGFHHWGIGTRDFDSVHKKYTAAGYEAIFTDRVPGGGRIAYYDSTPTLPGMTEVIEVTESVEALFQRFQHAAIDWDGAHPVRPFF